MINFKFVKSQFKYTIIPSIICGVVLFLLVIFIFKLCSTFSPEGSTFSPEEGKLPAFLFLKSYYFINFIIFNCFGIVLINFLLVNEVSRGYIASWLTSSMSRKTILNSKLFLILSLIGILNITLLFFKIIIFAGFFSDFKSKEIQHLLLTDFCFLFLLLFSTAINWFIMINLNKPIALSLAIGLLLFFIVSYYLIEFNIMKDLFNYLNIFSLFNLSIEYFTPKIPDNFSVNYKTELKPINILNFIWQLPIMLVMSFGLFFFGNLIFMKKSLSV